MTTRPMRQPLIEDRNIEGYTNVITPAQLKEELPLTRVAAKTILESRASLESILRGEEDRMLFTNGQCSAHDLQSHMSYADRAAELAERTVPVFLTGQRVMVEKPRTTVGYMGVIHDPHLTGEEDMDQGLRIARRMLLYTAEQGLATVVELLTPNLVQYFSDVVTLGIIGARTVSSPGHRHMASGMSMPIGNKNDTHGDVGAAIDAVITERHKHAFSGVDQSGMQSTVHTKGNPYTFIVLRGGQAGPNYDHESVTLAQKRLVEGGLEPNVMVDTNHGNSGKDYTKQPGIFLDVVEQRANGNRGIIGTMTESFIVEGRQDIPTDPKDIPRMKFGMSVTDGCQSWADTEAMAIEGYRILMRR